MEAKGEQILWTTVWRINGTRTRQGVDGVKPERIMEKFCVL